MKRVVYSSPKFGYVGDEFFTSDESDILMRVVKFRASQYSRDLDGPVSIRIIEV